MRDNLTRGVPCGFLVCPRPGIRCLPLKTRQGCLYHDCYYGAQAAFRPVSVPIAITDMLWVQGSAGQRRNIPDCRLSDSFLFGVAVVHPCCCCCIIALEACFLLFLQHVCIILLRSCCAVLMPLSLNSRVTAAPSRAKVNPPLLLNLHAPTTYIHACRVCAQFE